MPPMVRKQQQQAVEPEKMIDNVDPPVPNDPLILRIAVAIAQIGDVPVNGTLEGKGCTEMDSYTNICVSRKN